MEKKEERKVGAGTNLEKLAECSGFQVARTARRNFFQGTPWRKFQRVLEGSIRGSLGHWKYTNYKLYALRKENEML